MKSKLAVLLYLFVCIFVYFNRQEYKLYPVESDASGYYAYLPAAFLYHDILYFDFYKGINDFYHINGTTDRYGIYDNPNGKRTNKYAIGTALFELPFFLLAHLYCQFDHSFRDDGYSYPFEIMVTFSTIFWAFLGLLVLRKFLARHFSDNATAITILCIGFGTNLYCYTIFQPGFSHPCSFFIIASVLYYTDLWYSTLKTRYIYTTAILLGLALITRPINITIAIFTILWMVSSYKDLRERVFLLLKFRGRLALALLLLMFVALIQMSYWYFTTGHWIYYSYVGESFTFSNPHMWAGLFSWRKGWFIYTPIAFFGVLGFIPLWLKNRKMIAGPFLFLLSLVYIVFSWDTWWYGGGFSARPLIDALPVIALPLAAMVTYVLSMSNIILRNALLVIISLSIILNLFQSYQYVLGILPCDGINAADYWNFFGKYKL